jgi:hypothetical protein
MAVVTVKSGVITNRDATPRVINNSPAAFGAIKGFVGSAVVTSGDSVASKYLLGQVPSNAVVRSLGVSCPDLGTTTIADFGIYKSTADGGAVVDASFFGSAVSLKDGALTNSDITNESGTFSLANAEQPLWQALGLASDPGLIYDVVATLTGACDGTGSLVAKMSYAI